MATKFVSTVPTKPASGMLPSLANDTASSLKATAQKIGASTPSPLGIRATSPDLTNTPTVKAPTGGQVFSTPANPGSNYNKFATPVNPTPVTTTPQSGSKIASSPSTNVTPEQVAKLGEFIKANPNTGAITTGLQGNSVASQIGAGASTGPTVASNTGVTTNTLPSATGPQPGATSPTTDITREGLLRQLLTQATVSPEELALAARKSDAAAAAAKQIADQGLMGGDQALHMGTGGVLQGVANTQQAAYDAGLARLAALRGQTADIYQSAIGAQPLMPNVGFALDPSTGKLIGTEGGQLDSLVQQAVQLVQNGATPNDAMTSSGLSSFGLPGQAAFTRAMQQVNNGTYNPTAQTAVAGQNVSQKIGAQEQAFQLDTGIKQLDVASDMAKNFLASEDLLNPSRNKRFNDAISDYVNEFKNPGSVTSYNAIMGDIKKFTSQILATGSGTIPTDRYQTLQTFDPAKLNAIDLVPYLETLKQLGDNQKSILQSQIGASSGSQPYAGSLTTIDTSSKIGPDSKEFAGSNIDSKYGQAAAGGLAGLWDSISGAFSSIIGGLIKK